MVRVRKKEKIQFDEVAGTWHLTGFGARGAGSQLIRLKISTGSGLSTEV